MDSADNEHRPRANKQDVIAGVITAIILVITTVWLVILLF